MGIDISFTYETDDKSRFLAPELSSDGLVDLFEAPDVLKHLGAFGGTMKGLEAAGFLPSFVVAYREGVGSQQQTDLESTEEESAATGQEWGAFSEDDEWDNPSVDFVFQAEEAQEWADLWLRLLETNSFQQQETLQIVLPYNHRSVQQIKADLQQLRSQAEEAKNLNFLLRIEAILG